MLLKLGMICNGAACCSFRVRRYAHKSAPSRNECAHKSASSRNRKAPRILYWLIFHWKILKFTETFRYFTEKYWVSLKALSKNFIRWKQNALLQNTEIQWKKLKLHFFHWKILTFSEMQWKSYTFFVHLFHYVFDCYLLQFHCIFQWIAVFSSEILAKN